MLGEHNGDLFLLIRDHFEQRGKEIGGKIRHELEFTRNDERSILSGVVVFPPANKDYYLFYLIDITQQKNLEGELRRRNAFFQNLIDSSVDGIIASDMKGKIMLFNQEAMSLLGYSQADIENLHVTQLYNEGCGLRIDQKDAEQPFWR